MTHKRSDEAMAELRDEVYAGMARQRYNRVRPPTRSGRSSRGSPPFGFPESPFGELLLTSSTCPHRGSATTGPLNS